MRARHVSIPMPATISINRARERERGEQFWIELCGRPAPAKNTADAPGGERAWVARGGLAVDSMDDEAIRRAFPRKKPGKTQRHKKPEISELPVRETHLFPVAYSS
jgi:hypothetical protein